MLRAQEIDGGTFGGMSLLNVRGISHYLERNR